MQVCSTTQSLQQARAVFRQQQLRVGFVPTMGNLHQGHLALVTKARQHCDIVVVSIFVNPLQFNNANDLDSYPRTLEDDLAKLKTLGVELVFTPTAEDIYPHGLAAETRIDVPGVADILEGAMRPGHFSGVATIVTKLFNLVQPQVAVFGEKDYQQLALIQKMTHDLFLPVEILSLSTVREEDGLAMSSRNNRLSSEQRHLAPYLATVMKQLADTLTIANVDEQIQYAQQQLSQHGFVCDGIDIVDASNLQTLTNNSSQAVILVAAFLGEVRLIDNVVVSLTRPSAR